MGMMGGFGSGFGNYGAMGGGSIGWLVNIAILVGVVLLVVWAVKQFSRGSVGVAANRSTAATTPPSAREILETRYARGELSREDYLTTLNDLSRGEI